MANTIPGVKGFVRVSVSERFWAKVEKTDTCWRWLGYTSKAQTYGRMSVDGVQRPVSQVAWSLFRGRPWPEGMYACHTCDNQNCVNPLHIFPGTPSMNTVDAIVKGRLIPPRNRATWTHCKRGHPFTEDNIMRRDNERSHQRECRTCKKERNARRYRPNERVSQSAAPSGGERER